MPGDSNSGSDTLLYLTDDQLRAGIEAMCDAYRGFHADLDRLLREFGYGHAHHRALHFIARHPDMTVSQLLMFLGVTKQSLSRALRRLTADGLIRVQVGSTDRRTRHLRLTEAGRELEEHLSALQRKRMRTAYRAAGPEAVAGFRKVLEQIMDTHLRHQEPRPPEL
ncbi:MAG: MarR family transcriptional regulator [Rhodobacteraceae bacterium]|nr:MarR family transcriptional regulator [Paracoccaceae bacterium]MCY4196061.1 MarR family transcriptional regulator [Paracoccaceae bacterium]MCY4327940.1 MarR family transcriptional regulator [Paracoccaceae bacterium]